jgi:hypothetical protein
MSQTWMGHFILRGGFHCIALWPAQADNASTTKRATDMLEIMCIGVLLCIVAIQFITAKVLLRRLRNLQKHCDSWKAAAEHWEKQSW